VNLFELLLVLTLLAILSTAAAPNARAGMDGLRVRHAREAAFALATRTRAIARERGGADLVLDLENRQARIQDTDGTVLAVAAFPDCKVEVTGATARVVLRYDAHGLGRMASRTIRFERGSAQAGLTVSAYGRIRRW
jgi:Tfp pilus assembly protein FimT